jgi:uncharacterized protein YegP (UPF0339 family)
MLHDDYLSCGQYENQPKHTTAKQFSVFVDVKSGKHFFALLDLAGNVLFRSEGYETEKARENGVESVTKNMPLAARYAVVNEGSQYMVSLKAANHREIARSCPFATEAEAKTFVMRLSGKKPFEAPAPKVVAPKAKAVAKPVAKAVAKPAVKAVAKPVAKPVVKAVVAKPVAKAVVAKPVAKAVVAKPVAKAVVAKPVVKAVVAKPVVKAVAKPVAKPVVKAVVAKPVVKAVAKPVVKAVVAKPAVKAVAPKVEKAVVAKAVKVVATPVAKATPAPKAAKTTGYATQGFYLGHETLTFGQIQTGYTKFVGQDGNYYFAVYNPDGTLYLGSSAFALAEMRDITFVAVVQSIENPSCYNVAENNGAFFVVLSGVDGKELARSAAFGSFTEAFKTTPNGRVRSEVSLY